MSFCTICGTQAKDSSAKFCHKCGASLILEEDNSEKDNEKPVNKDVARSNDEIKAKRSGTYELGVALEEAVEEILKAEGYSTERRVRLSGKKGTSEIDIIASKIHKDIKEVLAVECKNFSSSVPVKEIRDFDGKLKDLNIKNGLFAARPNFSSEASQWGQNAGLQLWNEDDLKEKYFEVKIGRLGEKGQRLDYCLPLKINYEKATEINIENKDEVEIENAKLIWKPYYKFSFKMKFSRTNPRKERHTYEDSGYYIIDGLNGNIPQQSDAVKNVVKKIIGQSSEARDQIKETDLFLKELDQDPDADLDIKQSNDYNTIILKPIISEEKARKTVLTNIVQDNTHTTYYKLKRDEDDLFAPEKEFIAAPNISEIRIIDSEIIHVPKWEVEFRSREYKYVRKLTGNSGTVIYDTITNCNKHLFAGLTKKKNIAVCNICGEILCKDHIWKCSTCSSWRCETHSIICTSCQKRYCPEHIPNKCKECNNAVCDSCSTKCPICGEIHCKKHMTKCSKCGRIVCVSCTRKEGGILSIGQKVYCKDC